MADTVTRDQPAKSSAIPLTSSPSISGDPLSVNPMLDFPIMLRDLSAQSSETAKEHWQTMKSAGVRLTSLVQATCSVAAKESLEYGNKVIETAAVNTRSALELANALAKAKTPSEIVEISAAHARKQIELVVTQNRQLWMAAQKMATSMFEAAKDASKP